MEATNEGLLHACLYGEVATVKKFLDLGANINCEDDWGDTPLHLACGRYCIIPEIVTTLLENSCKPNERNKEGNTALHIASNTHYNYPDIITTLLRHGCKPDEKNKQGKTALHIAVGKYGVNPELIIALIKGGLIPDVKDNEGRTALHVVVDQYPVNRDIITVLVKNGLNLDETDKEGRTVLDMALGHENENTIRILLENGFNPNKKDKEGRTALHLAAGAIGANGNIVKALIGYGCFPNEKDKQGRTALHVAVDQIYVNPNIVTTLIENGCKPNEKDKKGRTALHVAVDQNNVSPIIVTTLLENGCNPNEKDKKGRTALHVAVDQPNVDPIILTTLLKNGCNPNEKEIKGKTALHCVATSLYMKPTIIKTLLKHGCKPGEMDGKGKTPCMILKARIMEHGNGEEEETAINILKEYEDYWQLGLPIEVKELDRKSANVFASLLEEEGYKHYEARVMLAGEQGTGKTTVARYLVGKGPTQIRVSTDGIDLYNGLSFIDRETDEWLNGKQDFTLSEITISRSLRNEFSTVKMPESAYCYKHSQYTTTNQEFTLNDSKPVNNAAEDHSVDKPLIVSTDDDQSEKMRNKNINDNTDVGQPLTERRISGEKTQKEEEKTEENPKLENVVIYPSRKEKEEYPHADLTSNVTINKSLRQGEGTATTLQKNKKRAEPDEETMHRKNIVTALDEKEKNPHADKKTKFPEKSISTEVVKNPDIIGKLKKLFGIYKDVKEINVSMTKENFLKETLKVGKKKLHKKRIAPVIIWDFGGQDVFYSTHQTFLTYRAIYLILLDGSRNLDDPCPYDQYLPGKSGYKTARDYLKFWINTIVTYCKGSGPGFPKILIVLTHKDIVQSVKVETRRQQIFNDIKKMFSGSPLLSHLVIKEQIFVNARDGWDPEMAKIKTVIIEQARAQLTWGQILPKCFIPLELEFDALLNRNIPLITMEHMKLINSNQPVRSLNEGELQVFLKFQHSVGRILYFAEANLNQHIILSPTHLIDAFKSIVTDRKFCEGDRLRQESWDLMSQKGVIGKKSIEEIWKKNKYKKFQKHKEYLLGVMTHLDILVEPKRYDTLHKRVPAEFYYIASMVRTKNTTGYLESPNFAQKNISVAFSSSSSVIPPALSFRFVSYCLSLFAVKTYGQKNDEMLFHMSAVFTIDPSLDMSVSCDDEVIVVRLIHSKNRVLIMRDLASSIRECLAVALEKISQLYVKTSSTGSVTDKASFSLSLCCSSPVDPCLLSMFKLEEQDDSWICPKHGIEHTKDVLSSWALQQEQSQCGVACPVTDNDFLKQFPTDIHLRRLSMQYSVNEVKEILIYLQKESTIWQSLLYDEFQQEPETLKFETLRKFRDEFNITFNDIRKAVESGNIQNTHTLCKVVRGKPIDFDQEPELWDLLPTEEQLDRLAPIIGNNSLAFLVELGMEFTTWEQIQFKQNDRDLVKLNRDILQEWRITFCNFKNIRPSLRLIGQAFKNIGKNIKIVENILADFF